MGALTLHHSGLQPLTRSLRVELLSNDPHRRACLTLTSRNRSRLDQPESVSQAGSLLRNLPNLSLATWRELPLVAHRRLGRL